ncbi:hypothetical protein BKA64DRAFT_706026 [Cadophora sp. MPI-SDFR-AT-0126]|nr:hypothetical protein BKA64DRAFT_706026 [Leotiomycetes sp. MPI-SDFR-AT-0126]
MPDFPTDALPTSLPTSIFNGDDDIRSFFAKQSSSSSTFDTSTSSQTTPKPSMMTSYTPSPVIPASYPTNSGYPGNDTKDNFFERLESGTKAAVGVAITVGVIIIVALSVWYCCGCCGLRARRRKRREGMRAPDINSQRPVPLNAMASGQAPPPAGDAPPQYEEAVPPQHQHIAGGARHMRQEEDDAVISDGKTPLSEIPFEDVVLDHSPSEGSSRSFSERHHGLGGDTRGHTNT